MRATGKSLLVALLTPTSVACAERITATAARTASCSRAPSSDADRVAAAAEELDDLLALHRGRFFSAARRALPRAIASSTASRVIGARASRVAAGCARVGAIRVPLARARTRAFAPRSARAHAPRAASRARARAASSAIATSAMQSTGQRRQAKLAARALGRDHRVHALRRRRRSHRPDRPECISCNRCRHLRRSRATSGGPSMPFAGSSGFGRRPSRCRQRGDAFDAAGRALIDVRASPRDRFGVRAARRIAAARALRLRQQRVDARGERFMVASRRASLSSALCSSTRIRLRSATIASVTCVSACSFPFSSSSTSFFQTLKSVRRTRFGVVRDQWRESRTTFTLPQPPMRFASL